MQLDKKEFLLVMSLIRSWLNCRFQELSKLLGYVDGTVTHNLISRPRVLSRLENKRPVKSEVNKKLRITEPAFYLN